MNRTIVATRMADAAATWLDTLDGDQRGIAQWPFPAEEDRRRWFYTPTDHGGLTLARMTPSQQQGAMRLLHSGLSQAGYVTATTVIGLENTLDGREGFTADFGRERARDPQLYFTRVFGEPGAGRTWGWRFGGHHVSVNHTIVDGGLASSTPSFLGSNPGSAPLLGPHLLRPLAGAEDLGRELVRSLEESQLDTALLSATAPTDLVTAHRSSAVPVDRDAADWTVMEVPEGLRPAQVDALSLTAVPKGIAATQLDGGQRELLRALLGVYVGRVPDDLADAEAAKYAADGDLDQLSFAWAGGLLPGDPHYYRVQGTRLLAEYDNTQDGANHIHTVWRDLGVDAGADFGGDVLAAHYAQSHR